MTLLCFFLSATCVQVCLVLTYCDWTHEITQNLHTSHLLTMSLCNTCIGVFGAYLLAVYDDETETYQTISKLGTGFSEEQLVQLADMLRPSIIPAPRPYYQVNVCLVGCLWITCMTRARLAGRCLWNGGRAACDLSLACDSSSHSISELLR